MTTSTAYTCRRFCIWPIKQAGTFSVQIAIDHLIADLYDLVLNLLISIL